MIKRILINVILIAVLLIFLEFICFIITQNENEIFQQSAERLESNKRLNYTTKYKILEDFNPKIFRKSFIKKNSAKEPLILFGCSFAEGAGLEDNNTPCAIISKLTGRSCINKSKGATGLQFMLYQLKDENFYRDIPNAEYIVYIYIHDHIVRLYNYQINPLIYMFNLRYKLHKDELKEIKPFFKPFYSSYMVKRFLNTKVFFEALQEEKNYKLFNAIMEKSVKLIKQHYPGAKIILLEYPQYSSLPLSFDEIKKLEQMGITVVKVTELTKNIDIYDKQYWLNDNIHPNEKAWNIVLPELVKKYIR